MPDILMCESTTCPLAKTCYRNEKSGTKPCEFSQTYFWGPAEQGYQCKYYWPTKEKQNE